MAKPYKPSGGKPSKPKRAKGPSSSLQFFDHGERDKKGRKLIEVRQRVRPIRDPFQTPGKKKKPPKPKPHKPPQQHLPPRTPPRLPPKPTPKKPPVVPPSGAIRV